MGNDFDFLVIGGGSAGYAAARTAREQVERVAIVDGATELGGLCILRGCMPSKTLIYAAEVLHKAQQAKHFGLKIPEASLDMAALQQKKGQVIGEFADYRREQLESDRFTLIRQSARFVEPHRLRLADGSEVTADKIVIATGSKVAAPPVPGLEASQPWTSDDVLALSEKPESVLVLGGGVVACELAQFLARAGCQVHQLQRSAHILKLQSPKAATVVEEAMRADGVDLRTGTKLMAIERDENGYTATFEQDGSERKIQAQRLFNAMGRRPATDELGLEEVGVRLRPSGHIETNSHQQSSLSHVYAAGDCAGPHEIVHVAILQGECAAKHALGQPTAAINERHLTSVVFTSPQIATVGLSAQQLEDMDIEFVDADYPFDDHGKSILMEEKRGYVRVLASKADGCILGAECVGPDASELIHAMAVAITLGAKAEDLLKVHWYHPTLSEIWSYPLEDVVEAVEE